jgi:hypothetical protein
MATQMLLQLLYPSADLDVWPALMRNPRLYVLIICVGLLARASHRGALQDLNGEFEGWTGLVTFWIPVIGLLCIAASLLMPVMRRWLRRGS